MSYNNPMSRQSCVLVALLLIASAALFAASGAGEAATPTGPLAVQVAWDNPQVEAGQPGERMLELLVSAPQLSRSGEHPAPMPLNLALVIDTSGSMAQEGKLAIVKTALHRMLDRLRPGDRFALVSYDSSARVCLPSEPVEDMQRARQVIDALQPSGSTNMAAGLAEGYRQIRRNFNATGINRVFLLSDGLANVGETSPARLAASVEEESRSGISLSSFGVGVEFNEVLMAELSERGRGMYYYIDEPARIEELLGQAFGSTQQVAAKDVELTLTLNPRVFVTTIFANSYQHQGQSLTMQAGDLSAGERRRIQLRISIPASAAGTVEIGQVRIRYQQPGEAVPVTISEPLRLRAGTYGAEIDSARDWQLTERTQVFEANYTRDRAAEIFERGEVTTAKAMLQESLHNLSRAQVRGEKVMRELEATRQYLQSLEQQLDATERGKRQKALRYRKHTLEGC